MEFQNNVSELNFIYNQPVSFTTAKDGKIYNFSITLPSVKQVYFDQGIQTVLGVIRKDLDEFKKDDSRLECCGSIWEVIKMFIFLLDKEYVFYASNLRKGLAALVPQIEFEVPPTVAGCEIDDSLFAAFCDIWLVSLGFKKLTELNSTMTPEMRKMQERINRIRNKDKTNSKPNDLRNYIILTYEFGYTKEQILDMTIYQMNKILGYLGKSIQYKVSLIGAGNGLTKKVKFLTEKE